MRQYTKAPTPATEIPLPPHRDRVNLGADRP